MPSLSSTYLIPAILLNPAFILHLINTFASHIFPPIPTVSVSPHPFMESIGPVPGSKPYLDMHADDQLCWTYTGIMVFVQLLAFGRVQDNRVKRKSAKAARVEREQIRKEKLEKLEAARSSKLKMHENGFASALDMDEILEEFPNGSVQYLTNGATNGCAVPINGPDDGQAREVKDGTPETEGSTTETSEEEMMV